jgi:DNA-binding beta-propeller fold protein YncE
MRPSCVPDRVAGRTHTGAFVENGSRVRLGPARVASGVLAVCAVTLALGASTVHAQLFLPLSNFGSQGSGAGQFQGPRGVAVDQASGDVYVADSGNARVQKFDATGTFIAAWGWGVADGTAQSEVCTSSCQAGIAGAGAGQFSNPTSIAVDSSGGPSAGDVYVGDLTNNVVLKFDANGNFLSSIDGSTTPQGLYSSLVGVAVDQSGHLWTADGNTDNVTEFDENGTFVQQWTDPFGNTLAIAVDRTNSFVYLIRGSQDTERFNLTGGDETVIEANDGTQAGVALSLDPASGTLYIGHSDHVTVYDTTGAQLDSFALNTSNSQGLAFGTTAGVLYVSDATAADVTIYGPPTTPGPPLVFSESATNASDTGATLNTQIVPFGLDTTCQFQYVDDAAFQATGYSTATSVPCVPADLGSSFTLQLATATVSGLTSQTTYHFRAVATNADGTVNGADKTFQTTGPSIIKSESATNITATDATLNTTINPNGLDTTCQFQYVDDADFQATGYTTATSVPCSPADLGSSFTDQSASADVTGLTPDTTYHFRAVATSADGTANGADQTFLTLVAKAPTVVNESATNITDTGATLNATINPNGLDTTCQFQYVADTAFQATGYTTATSVPCSPADLGASFTAQSATASVTGLTPGTTYHFRVVATNADGTTTGADTTLQTLVSFLLQVGSFGSAGSGAGQFQSPVGVAVDQNNGRVYVADSGNARIQKFDSKGKFTAAIGWGVTDGKTVSEVCKDKKKCQAGIAGSGPGQFSNPTSVAVDSSSGPSRGAVYVGDTGTNVVVKLNASGKYLSTITGSITPQGHFVSLAGVAVDQGGNLWTADAATGNVDEFGNNGHFIQQWNSPSGVRAIAVDAINGAVYLINGGGATQRFTLDGVAGTTIDNGSGTALALDPKTGNLYVDHGADVVVYDSTGARIDTLFSLGATTNSQGLALAAPSSSGRQNRLYVSDATNDEVTIYGPPSSGAPFVTAESARTAGKTSETLKASIVPLGHSTTCTFQYVDSTDFQATGYTTATSVACTPAKLGSSFSPQQASATVSGLTVGTFYHFHVIATNSAGTTTGAEQTFQAGPGDWTPFTRCPVDDPAMLATDGGVTTLGLCVASNSSHGSFAIGTTTTLTGNTNLQIGVVINETTGVTTVVGSPGGALVADPAQVTVGTITVTATVESAGLPSNFNFIAGIELGVPIITIPIKIHLESLPGAAVDLGPSCFIGSDQAPILLNPENTDLSNAQTKFEMFDPDGTPDPNGTLETIVVTGAVQGDNTFAVPGAQGCGPNGDGSLNAAVNAVVGLPSPTGSNHLVLDDAGSFIAAPINGQTGVEFSAEWHSVFN